MWNVHCYKRRDVSKHEGKIPSLKSLKAESERGEPQLLLAFFKCRLTGCKTHQDTAAPVLHWVPDTVMKPFCLVAMVMMQPETTEQWQISLFVPQLSSWSPGPWSSHNMDV